MRFPVVTLPHGREKDGLGLLSGGISSVALTFHSRAFTGLTFSALLDVKAANVSVPKSYEKKAIILCSKFPWSVAVTCQSNVPVVRWE